MANSANPNQLASEEANWSGSTLVCKGRTYSGSAGLGLIKVLYIQKNMRGNMTQDLYLYVDNGGPGQSVHFHSPCLLTESFGKYVDGWRRPRSDCKKLADSLGHHCSHMLLGSFLMLLPICSRNVFFPNELLFQPKIIYFSYFLKTYVVGTR